MHFMIFKSDKSYIVAPPQIWIKKNKKGLTSNSLLQNLYTMTRNAVEGISDIS
jgi:hypothetical protein